MLLIIINVRKTKESGPSILMRILTNYLQIITSSLSMSTSYPDSLSNIFIPVKKVGGLSDIFLSFDCFITDFEIKGPFNSNAVFKLFLPLILFAVVALFWLIIKMVKPLWVKNMKRYLVISFISILFSSIRNLHREV